MMTADYSLYVQFLISLQFAASIPCQSISLAAFKRQLKYAHLWEASSRHKADYFVKQDLYAFSTICLLLGLKHLPFCRAKSILDMGCQ